MRAPLFQLQNEMFPLPPVFTQTHSHTNSPFHFKVVFCESTKMLKYTLSRKKRDKIDLCDGVTKIQKNRNLALSVTIFLQPVYMRQEHQ
jgi:hypothetical protein